MKKIPFGLLMILFFTNQIFAQKSLLFLNTKTNKTIEVSEGQTISIQYQGYNNQVYHYKNLVTEINDSTIVLGNIADEPAVWIQKLSKKFEPNYRIVAIKDIVAFRRITVGRQMAKNLISTSITVGTIFLGIDLFQYSKYTFGQNLLISLGFGLVSSTLNAFILPENPKYKIINEWVITVKN